MTWSLLGGRRALALAVLIAAACAVAVGLLVTKGGGPGQAGAADHLDAPGLTPPGGDPRTDITDIYAFKNGANTVLIMDVNGLNAAGKQVTFARSITSVAKTKAVSYKLNVDNNGDAVADHALSITFGKPRGASQVQRMWVRLDGKPLVSGWTSRFGQAKSYAGGGSKAFAGMRDDPFFFDLDGFINILAAIDADPSNNANSFIGCTGPRPDKFAGSNVGSIVVELPSSKLTASGSTKLGIWASTDLAGAQIDRMGRPAINTVFLPNNPFPGERVGEVASMKSTFNHGDPKNDQAAFRGEVVNTLTTLFSLNDPATGLGGKDNPADDVASINGLADILLPDILTFDTSSDAGFLNGRRPSDDVIDAELGLVTEGLVTTDCVSSNDAAFPSTFPYLAAPHA